MDRINQNLIIKCLILAIPPALVLSIFILELIFFILTLFFLYEVSKRKINKEYLNNFNNLKCYVIILFVVYVSLNSISIFQEIPSRKTFFYFRFILYFISFLYYLSELKIFNLLLKSFFLIAVVLIVDGLIQFITGFNILGFPMIIDNRVSSLFGDELILGSYLIRLLPFNFILMIFLFRKKITFFILTQLLILTIVFLSGERTALFLYCLFFFSLFIFIKNFRKKILFIFIFLLLFSSTIIIFNPSYHERYILNIADGFGVSAYVDSSVETEDSFTLFSEQHESHFKAAYLMFKDNILFGKGTRSFRIFCKEKKYIVNDVSCSSHPHNIIMQFLSELGLFGIIFLMIFHFFIISEIRKIFKSNLLTYKKNILIISLLGIFINVFPFIPSGNFFNNWFSIILLLNLANYHYNKKRYLNE